MKMISQTLGTGSNHGKQKTMTQCQDEHYDHSSLGNNHRFQKTMTQYQAEHYDHSSLGSSHRFQKTMTQYQDGHHEHSSFNTNLSNDCVSRLQRTLGGLEAGLHVQGTAAPFQKPVHMLGDVYTVYKRPALVPCLLSGLFCCLLVGFSV